MTRRPSDRVEGELDDELAEDEEIEGEWELDPNDPTHPDHDLSESAGYASWEPLPKPFYLRRGVMLLVAVLVIVGLFLPFILRVT